MSQPAGKRTVIGASPPRIEGREKVTGAATYVDDMQFGPSLLHGALKRSPIAHGRIVRIDASRARALPGVRVVVTGEDFPGLTGLYLKDRRIFALDRVRSVGEAVAGVAADTPEIAAQALDLIEVEYEELPGVFDPEYGASPEAPIIHPELASYEVVPFVFPQPGTNISNWFKVRKGDMAQGWAEADLVYEHKYRVPHVQHVPLETHVCVAQQNVNGKITLWSSSQSPFAQRNLIAKALHIDHSRLRVITPYVGGGFGSKAGVSMEGAAVALAMHAKGRPVKLRMTREEEFHTTFVRQGLVAILKMGMTKDGRITAMHNRFYWDGGASTEYGVNITRAAGYSGTGPYYVPNIHVDSYCVYTNHPVGGAMRGFGMPEIHFGIEQHIDEMAHRLGLDPVEVRLKNCLKDGDETLTGMPMHPTGLSECIRKAAAAINWGQETVSYSSTKRHGKGLAAMWKAPAMPPNPGSSALVRLNEDGTATVSIGGVDIGQGALTAMAQFAAEGIGIRVEDVRVNTVDTDYSPYEWQTVASRLTWSMGNAVLRAADAARTQVLQAVAEAWDEDISDLDIVDGQVISYRSEESIPLKNICIDGVQRKDGTFVGGPVVAQGRFMPDYVTPLDPETGQGPRAVVHFTTGCQAVEVEVDTETGEVQVLKIVSAYDVGKAINPELVRTQMEGGAVQGLSTALLEGLILDHGVPRNPNFTDYRIATAVDAPLETENIIVEVPQDDGPFGARGVGEHPMVPTAPAIANAIYNAVGVRLDSMPLTSEKVWAALQNNDI
ncbi:MAG: 4-hydroxybenzoyl-CoA reductase subunit alpha [Chloroflexi bacterium ADurb.Bin325]|nr:MAG: 4-hydroxybenzoyl-CoA reductase subunit alpha [Chloroflexi bacterium ADurb.Bin325]